MSFQTPSKFIIWKEIEAMKSQAEGLTREYDRVCEGMIFISELVFFPSKKYKSWKGKRSLSGSQFPAVVDFRRFPAAIHLLILSISSVAQERPS